MAGYIKHGFIGLFIGMVSAIFLAVIKPNTLTIYFSGIIIIMSIFFSLLPDIDSRNSIIGSYTFMFLGLCIFIWIFGLVSFISGLVLCIFTGFLVIYHLYYSKKNIQHRQLPHSIWFGLISCLVMYFVFESFALLLVCAISFISHLLLDEYLKKSFNI